MTSPNSELEEILFPCKLRAGRYCGDRNYPYIHRDAKPGVTMALLGKYCRSCHEAGKTPYT